MSIERAYLYTGRADPLPSQVQTEPLLKEDSGHLKVAKAWARVSRHDAEKAMDLMGKITGYADTGLSCVYTPLQILGIVAHFFGHVPAWESLSFAAKLVVGPYCIIYFALAALELLFETVKLSRAVRLLRKLESNGENSQPEQLLATLQSLRDRFLSVREEEISALKTLIQSSNSSPEEQEVKLATLSEKMLEMKYKELKTRISRWCAEELKNSCEELITELQSTDAAIAKQAAVKAHELVETIVIQAKKKRLIHILSILAILFFVAATILVLVALTPAGVAIALSAIAMSFFIAALLVKRGAMKQRGWQFSLMDALPECLKKSLNSGFKLQAKAF